MDIKTAPRHTGYSGRYDDRVILVNGREIGGVYYCTADYVKRGQKWASWGPAGLSMGHRTREDALSIQVTAHATPDAVTHPV